MFFRCCITLVVLALVTGCADLHVGKAAYRAHDYQTARAHYSKLAEYDIPEAQIAYAQMLLRGEGGPVDKVLAQELLQRAAENGVRPTKIALGKPEKAKATRSPYQLGRKSEETGNIIDAAHYYEMAYDRKNYLGAYRMGVLYEKRVIPAEQVKALAWYLVAQKHHVHPATKSIARVSRKLSARDRLLARRMAERL